MNKTEFYKGWSIMIFSVGIAENAVKTMMVVKGGAVIDFGWVANDEKAFETAKRQIDEMEKDNRKAVV